MFNLITASTYWVLAALWLTILWLYVAHLRHSLSNNKPAALLLIILAIDAFRTTFESTYFGFYFNSLYGFLPQNIVEVLSRPGLLIIPKLLNVFAGLLTLFLIIRYWIPRDVRAHEEWISSLKNARDVAEEKRLEAENRASELNAVINNIPDTIVIADTTRRIGTTNQGLERTFGYTLDDVAGKTTAVLYADEDEYAHQGRLRFNTSAKARTEPYEVLYRRKNGETFPGETLGSPFYSPDGETLGFVGVIRDISERKKVEERLKLLASVFTHAREAILITDKSGTILEVNAAFSEITGYSKQDVLGQNASILQSGRHDMRFYEELWLSLKRKGYWQGEIWNRRKSGDVFPELLTISAVSDPGGQPEHYVGLFTDISDIKAHEAQLEHIAHFDPLTNLPNRVLLSDRIEQAKARVNRRKQSLAIAYLDLDDFKAVNDRHGHAVGDQLLVTVSARMKAVLRDDDTLARLGGDEFVAVLLEVNSPSDCELLLSRLLDAACQPVVIDEEVFTVSASIGYTLFPADEADTDQLIRHADQAMYIAKQSGKNRCHLFDVAQDAQLRNRSSILEQAKTALESSQFQLHYQPVVNMREGQLVGVEALIRWNHPERGMLFPDEFLGAIEYDAMSIKLGNWVLQTALDQMLDWQERGLHIPVSVNVSARHLQSEDFSRDLEKALAAKPDIVIQDLTLEVLETSALRDIPKVTSVMRECLKLGVSFALDDFGTGYSSLTYLKGLPVKRIKIDQSFVRDMLDDPDDRAIVSAVIGLASAFERQIVAEGVETPEQGRDLLRMGCDLAQGYGIAQPMPAERIPEWIESWRPDPEWS